MRKAVKDDPELIYQEFDSRMVAHARDVMVSSFDAISSASYKGFVPVRCYF